MSLKEIILICGVVFNFYSCTSSEVQPESGQTFSDLALQILNPDTLDLSSSALSGTGTVIFEDPLSAISSAFSYTVTFSLAEEASLSLFSHAQSDTSGAIHITVTRHDLDLILSISDGVDTIIFDGVLDDLDAESEISLSFDIHNDEIHPHILVWSGSDFSEEEALLNSEEEEGVEFASGTGHFWGLILSNARVTSVSIDHPLFEE